MPATPGKLFSAAGWVYELKQDGFRCLITKSGDAVRLESRRGNNMSDRFPELVDELRALRHDLVADGELVMLDREGRSVWERLHGRHRLKDPKKIARAAMSDPAVLFAFDLLWLNGADIRVRTLLERKDALYRTLPANRRVRYATHIPNRSADLWQLATAMDLEGIVAKRADSTYSAGRSDYWQKVTPLRARSESEIADVRDR